MSIQTNILTMNIRHLLSKPIFTLLIVILILSQFSCDALEERSLIFSILRKMKFRVTEITPYTPADLKRYDVLFINSLFQPLLESEIDAVNNFVVDGGILIVCGGEYDAIERIVNSYDLMLRRTQNVLRKSQRYQDNPLFVNPVDEILVDTDFVVRTEHRDIAVLYGSDNAATILSFRHGEGRVYLTTSSYLFSWLGMNHAPNATFFYNLMSTLPNRARIGLAQSMYFSDESKPPNAFVESKPPNAFVELVFKTPGGLAAVYVCLILYIFLTLRGRRFGRPMDIVESHRRMSTEYIHAMTTLYQKGNTRIDILMHIRHQFRTEIGLRWRVDATLNTSAFLEELRNKGALDEDDTLTVLIQDLDRAENRTDRQLLDIAKRVEEYREMYKLKGSY